ncbi:Signal transduction histidine kinase-like protein [Pedobacter sp. BAL39]|uniref:hybrid sensor histidine kinase/response regulator n=1 Tax=Pedobacter sp. BAL39 TaxID=391596 RepID=UPI00015599A8|nr:hybrid sensor histidine kinase/response regulator [Pedobacter sp. BAL39]EDM38314.1 Signal transduction histidine kinase-like protein [Pedobacter sp. BAL39]
MLKKICLVCIFLMYAGGAGAQYIFQDGHLPEEVSILDKSEIADAGYKLYSALEIKNNQTQLKFKRLSGDFGNLGFTDHNYWVRFHIINKSAESVLYYLESSEPVTDYVNLYEFRTNGQSAVQRSGDHNNFSAKALPFRNTIFKIHLKAGEEKAYLMEVRNDGEKNTLPLSLISQEKLLKATYESQFILGIFYGILLIIAITYAFFYFATREASLLYYSLYVISLMVCHAALDGFFHQYILRSDSWLNLHAVILSAICGAYFFGKYSELILSIKRDLRSIYRCLQVMYIILALIFLAVVVFPHALRYSYPLVNVMTLSGMILIAVGIIVKSVRRQPIDRFFAGGVTVLFVCFLLVILRNFGLMLPAFFMDNISKIGIGLQIMALSLSMASRISLMKEKEKELSAIALQRSEEMNDVKSFFLSNMSHELRTPLNAILGLTDIISDENSDVKTRANLQLIKNASDTLISSLDDIFDFVKIEKGELTLDAVPFSLPEVLTKINQRFNSHSTQKGLLFISKIDIDKEVLLMGDQARMEQILNNLLGNAIKFTQHGYISFEVTSKQVGDQRMQISIGITDTGIGIAASKLDTIFEIFSQVEASNTRRFGGFGIGLSIVKTLVDLHKGAINIKSKIDVGTICTVDLFYDVVINVPVEDNVFPVDRYDLLGKNVLVVEDNKMNQMVLKMMFNKWENTRCFFADQGEEALTVLKNESIDVVLMDLQMPVMDGYEAISCIRAGKAGIQNVSVPIIVLTADLVDSTRQGVFELGVDDFMTKPVDQQLLYSKITSLL